MKGIRKTLLIAALAAAVQCFAQTPGQQDGTSDAPLAQDSKFVDTSGSKGGTAINDSAAKESKHRWLIGGVFGILGFGVVVAFRQYANKIVPDMPKTAKKPGSPKNLNGDPIEVSVKKPKW